MLTLVASVFLSTPIYAPAQPWALDFAAPPRIPLVGDVDGDGFADILCVYPSGDCIIDVALNVGGQKTGAGFQARTQWGKNCQAALSADLDGDGKADVLGLFDGETLRLASKFANRKFEDQPNWLKLPKKLAEPSLAWATPGKSIIAYSKKTKEAYSIDLASKTVSKAQPPRGGQEAPEGLRSALDSIRSRFFEADADDDGDDDIFEFRYGKEPHTRYSIMLHRRVMPGEKDSDHDMLTDAEEAQIGSDPMNPDTDNDGLLDGWEAKGFRDLDLPGMGCSPLHTDLICLLSRFDGLNEDLAKSELKRAVDYYAALNIQNPDGKTGWNLHLKWLDPVDKEDQKQSWQALRDKFLPRAWRGMVHWMQLTPHGGGQADQLGDGGGCGGGKNSLFATFVHEFGHQIGMDHSGFWGPSHCPIYRSLMNYAYSYSLEDDPLKVSYSRGELKDFILNETNLSEELPLPYEKVKFLEKGPYRFRLKPNGETTLIDWNWNGIFGEKGIRADINYSYSTSAGRRDTVDRTMAAPWWIVHNGRPYILYGQRERPKDKADSPDLSAENPGKLLIRTFVEPFKWEVPVQIDPGAATGDPVGCSDGTRMILFYPSKEGVLARIVVLDNRMLKASAPFPVSSDPLEAPSVGEFQGRLLLVLWNSETKSVRFAFLPKGFDVDSGKLTFQPLAFQSEIPPGLCEDTIAKELVIGLAQDQDERRKSRWQIRRYRAIGDALISQGSPEWVEGENGGAAGDSRCNLLFDASRDAGPQGRVLFYALGTRRKEAPWQCAYVAMQIADKSVRGGWLVKRYYDEWTQSRSAPAVAWWRDEILYAYRWVDGGQGSTDNNLHVGYRGSGIDPEPMGDFDDVAFMQSFGIRHSILWMNR